MYEYVRMRWLEGAWTEAQVDRATAKGWITAEQAAEIKALKR